jgi:DNA-binding Lrp family transcriptional regulator
MLSACMLIRAERGKFEEVAKNLRQIPEVVRVFPVLGRFDIVADLEAPNSRQLARAVIRASKMGGIVFTETLPEVEVA